MNLADIQGLLFRSYRRLPHASYVLLRFGKNPAAVRLWLSAFVERQRIDCASPKESGPVGSPDVRLNIAFAYSGLAALGLCRDALATFPMEFAEGLGVPWSEPDAPDHRSRILGDVGDSRPSEWSWGYQGDERAVDALLLAFARDPIELDHRVSGWIQEAEDCYAIPRGTAVTLWGRFPDDPSVPNREPFGFVDGISQPILRGASAQLGGRGRARQPGLQEIDDGEMLLGHRDGSRLTAASPTVDPECDPDRVLPVTADDSGRRDLGFNGTYLVFRQLAQNVRAFEDACGAMARSTGLDAEHVAALVVGRWKDGSPIISAPIAHDPRLVAAPAANDFTFASDPHGERCPMGAHIRRANPRDGLGDDPSKSLQITSRHRVLRRGRRYSSGDEHGLHFICLNASISRQFEFIQQNWINDPTFGGLAGEDDPLIGSRQGIANGGHLTLPPPPEDRVPRRVPGLRRFVTVKGGGYFFLPSLTALRYLAQARPVPERPSQPWGETEPAPPAADRIRALVLSRFSIMFALLLAGAPLGILAPGVSMIVRPTFDLDRPLEMVLVAALASLASAGLQVAFRIVHLYARQRFGVQTSAPPLTWRIVFQWQALSLPIVVTAWWRSAADAAFASASPWRAWWRFGGAAAAGYAAAFAVLYVAAAVRLANVRPRHAADAVLLPPPRAPMRSGAQPSAIGRLVAPIAHFIESRAALWPSVGVGYVDHKTGQILPGHLTALAFIATLGCLYAAGWFLLRPPHVFQLPPLAYFLFVILVSALATSGVAFFLDRFRVPLLTALVGWFVVATILGGTDHEFAVLPGALAPPPSVVEVIARADEYYRSSGPGGQTARPIVIVATAGGGIRQAVWTTQVLAGLTALWGPAFSENLRLVSAVSGGSVGMLPFLNEYGDNSPPHGDLQRLVNASETSASGDIWWGLVYADAVRVVVSYPPRLLFPRTLDRGWALEQGWRRGLGFRDRTPPSLSEWRAGVAAGWRPAVAFNATVVETGCRAVLATYRLPDHAPAMDVATVTGQRDLSTLTAARLSAAFPYVTPVARLADAGGPSMYHFADGGYWDNTGMVSALEWLREATDVLAHRRVLVIQIASAEYDKPTIHDRAWVWQLTAPLSTLVSVRSTGQRDRDALEIETMQASWHGADLSFVTLADEASHASLGWHLSRRERCDVEHQWWDVLVGNRNSELLKIEKVLGPPASGYASPSTRKGCAS